MRFKRLSRLEVILLSLISCFAIAGIFHLYSQYTEKLAKKKQADFVDLTNKQERCKADLIMGEHYVKSSPNLSRLVNEKIANPKLSQPSAAAGFTPDSPYVLIRMEQVALLPSDAVEPKNDFFKGLSAVGNAPPPPLKVNAKSIDIQNKQAVVNSDCSFKPFVVNLKDLYEIFQTVDYL